MCAITAAMDGYQYRAVVSGSTSVDPFTLYETTYTDAADGSPATRTTPLAIDIDLLASDVACVLRVVRDLFDDVFGHAG